MPVEALSLGHGRLVELGRALIGEPNLLMLDEPSSGLDADERRELVAILRRVHEERNTAILLVEHDVAMVTSVVSRLLVLDSGRLIADGPTAEVIANPAVRHTYLGRVRCDRHPESPRQRRAGRHGAGPRAAQRLRLVWAVPGVVLGLVRRAASFCRRPDRAEWVGQVDRGARLFGSRPRDFRDRPRRFGERHAMASVEDRRTGVAHVPEGRSVFGSLTVEENLELAYRAALGRHDVPEALERAYEAYPRLSERRGQLAGTLSGGEQRMLAVARVLSVPMKLLIVDELSLGLAPSAVDEVYNELGRVRERGTALLIIEQHADRALELVERAVVLSRNRRLRRRRGGRGGSGIERILDSLTKVPLQRREGAHHLVDVLVGQSGARLDPKPCLSDRDDWVGEADDEDAQLEELGARPLDLDGVAEDDRNDRARVVFDLVAEFAQPGADPRGVLTEAADPFGFGVRGSRSRAEPIGRRSPEARSRTSSGVPSG